MLSRFGRLALLSLLVLAACGGEAREAEGDHDEAEEVEEAETGLTAFQLEHGIGPVTEPVELGELDEALAEQGEALFETKCSACHKMEEKYVGPALGQVTVRRQPAFIMNMILNPQEMYTRHPAVRELLAQHPTQMPNQGLTREEARAVVEYLRTHARPTGS
jgi:mono/diheme cytochrome c family protein